MNASECSSCLAVAASQGFPGVNRRRAVGKAVEEAEMRDICAALQDDWVEFCTCVYIDNGLYQCKRARE